MNFRYFLLNVFLQIFICKNEDEEAQNILFHLKPNVFENQTSLATGIDNLLKKVNSHFNESNITSFYETLTSDGDASSLQALSVYHNWGLGVFEDPRIAVLHLNLGVLQEDQLALLSYNYKSLFGINVPKTCQANLDSLKSVTNEVARNFSLFERKEGSLIYINKEMEGAENQIIGEVLANLDEISRSNPKQLNNLFEIYLSSSLSKTPEATEKIFAYLEKSYRFTQSHEIAAYLGLLYLEKGNIHEVNYEKALGYLEIARAARIPHAYLGLGIIYFYGLGNYNLSFEFFVKANKSGRIEANTYLGISYLG
ncbi:hypothetical protein HZS_599 [Henneguya salminicola]|nr:hypothetical protein HZS_599 [Henneguya salminicola]